MYQVQLNKNVLRNHFHYDLWKYVAAIVITIFFWSMVTTIAAPRTPADKKVDIYMVGSYAFEEVANEIGKTAILPNFPELLEVNFFNIAVGGDAEMDYVGRQKLMVMLGTASGDIYMFDKEEFKVMAEQGAFLPLDSLADEFKDYFTEEQLQELTVPGEEGGEPHLYGLPMYDVKILEKTGYDSSNAVISVMAFSKNQEKAIQVMKWIIENGH